VEGDSNQVAFDTLETVLAEPDTQLRLFGKPEVHGHRRMGVVLARGETIDDALEKARRGSAAVTVKL
jgi:phosphoribosylglycinamide formyltransferase 2